MSQSIGEKLKIARGSRTQEEVAKALGISRVAYTSYEQDRRIPKDKTKEIIAKYYKIPISRLFFDV